MNKFIKKLIDKSNINFKQEFERQKKFFKKPDVLILLGIAALLLLDKMTAEKKSKKEIKDAIQKNKQAKAILAYSETDFNEDNLNDLLLACLNGNDSMIPEIPDGMEASDFISTATNLNDIDNKINFNKLTKLEIQFTSTTEAVIMYSVLLYLVIDMAKSLLKTEHPSKYKTKRTQKLLRNIYGLLKIEYDKSKASGKKEFKKILDSLKQIDNILIAITLATTIYLINRKKLRDMSKQTLYIIAVDAQCSPIIDAFDVSVNKIPFQMNLNCPVIIDDVVVPHMPIELKLTELSCELNQNEETNVEATQSIDLVTHAIIRNTKKNERLIAVVTKDAFATQELKIATLGSKALYSPVNGYVEHTTTDDIVIRDIVEPEEDFLAKQIALLNEKYERLNYVKSFLKEYDIVVLYPELLAIAKEDILIPPLLISGINRVYDLAKKSYVNINKDYEKKIKNITGKDNVEKHAKNETLNEIKDELEKQSEIFYKNLKLIEANAFTSASKTIMAKPSEYLLFEYYTLTLGTIFNGLQDPTTIEMQFRDTVNEFSRKRYVLEAYKKKNLEDAINDRIKDIEKGISLGNWFNKAIDVYTPNKKLDDVKKWLTGLANNNKNLDVTEKTAVVNSVMFLFEFYLNADKLNQKYNILKKETTPKKETIKEGNEITKFVQNLWLEFNSLPNEIIEIQKLIDSLSMFQTYSITEWNGYQARLYTLCDEPICKSGETDPYLNPKSQYGYGDIQYWLKYCSYATLSSVTNPVTGWSTGWIIPSPILMPVIYVPIKSILTKYGFIVLGLSICGIWLFPWTLFSNLSSDYNVPIGNPTAAIKREIDALKKGISEQRKNLRKSFIKNAMDDIKIKIDAVETELKTVKKSLADHKGVKPSKYPKLNDNNKLEINDIEAGVQKNLKYMDELAKWIEIEAGLREKIVTLKTKKWTLEKTHKILSEAYKLGKSVKGSNLPLEQSENQINKQLDNLTALVDKADNIIIPLPITMKPSTTNFGITLKNTKPIINIADELDDNVNDAPLKAIFDKFKLKNDGMMATTYGSKLSGSIVNYKAYKGALSVGMLSMIKKDTFPKYELLKPTNVPWVAFLYKDFVSTGAKTYGIPGQMPLPI